MAVSTNRLERAARALVASATILCFVGCGGGGVSVESSGGSGLVAGAAGDPALPALPAVAPSRTSPADADASGHLLTRLSVVFKRDATVGDVNAVAAAAQATAIAFAQPNSPFVTLAIPRQADATALRALAARVEPMRGVLSARGGHQPQPFDLPAGVVPIELDHLLATRFPAAWNLAHAVEAGCATRKVTVIVPDLFFGAPPNFAEQTEGVVEFTELPLEPVDPQPAEAHGYQVIGTLTAKFDSAQPHGANPLPSCLRVVAVDGRGLDMLEFLFRLRDAIAAESGPVIVSSSFGYNNYASLCPDGCVDLPAGFVADARSLVVDHFAKGIAWATFAMQPSVVDRVLFVQAAGNDGNQAPGSAYPGLRDARLGSP
nr:hypothetical protein [Caldimonas sp.]